MKYSPLIESLIKQLTCLPGVGGKSAQRMAFHLLERDREGAMQLSHALHDAMEHVTRCQRCRNFTEQSLCHICQQDKRRSSGLLCVVESPQDVVAIEQTADFAGTYFVLLGRLSPIDGVGPKELGLDRLDALLTSGEVKEVILATNFTMEGEATAHYIAEMCKAAQLDVTRLAQGVPIGGELEFIDGNTLSRALTARSRFE
ncbi:MAG: recombination mediator RecR [Aestuariibacter sp.]